MQKFLDSRWTIIRQACIFAGLILSMFGSGTLVYSILLLLALTAFVINSMQFIAKTRANMYTSIFYRLYDIIMLTFFLAIVGISCYLIYANECPVCSI